MNITAEFLKKSILIFDEAHNITDSIEDNASFKLTQQDLEKCQEIITSLKEDLRAGKSKKLIE